MNGYITFLSTLVYFSALCDCMVNFPQFKSTFLHSIPFLQETDNNLCFAGAFAGGRGHSGVLESPFFLAKMLIFLSFLHVIISLFVLLLENNFIFSLFYNKFGTPSLLCARPCCRCEHVCQCFHD